jgi:hypothetical protein
LVVAVIVCAAAELCGRLTVTRPPTASVFTAYAAVTGTWISIVPSAVVAVTVVGGLENAARIQPTSAVKLAVCPVRPDA